MDEPRIGLQSMLSSGCNGTGLGVPAGFDTLLLDDFRWSASRTV